MFDQIKTVIIMKKKRLYVNNKYIIGTTKPSQMCWLLEFDILPYILLTLPRLITLHKSEITPI